MNWHHQIIRTTTAHLFLLCLLVLSFCASSNAGKPVVSHRNNIICIDQERDALLKFKNHIQTDDCGLMSSWGNPNTPDCCTWNGVTCSNQSGHVIELRLSGAPYQWGCLYSHVFSPSLTELKHLQYLDLSSNYLYDMDIPSSITSLLNLVYLNLSGSYFRGNIPNQFGNLTRLTSLDLSHNDGLSVKSLNWLSRLNLLTDINLSGTNLSEATDWTQSIDSLPLLEVLQMDDCKLSTPLTSSSLLSANLRIVSLSGNDITSSSIFQWLINTGNYSSLEQSLEYLDLSGNFIQGPIPETIGYFPSLMHMDLSNNALSGSIPSTLGFSPLSYLDLSSNQLEGTIPASMTNLEYLGYLDLSSNYLSGDIPCKLEMREYPYYASFAFNNLSGSVPKKLSYLGSGAFLGNPRFRTGELQGRCDDGKNKINLGLYVSIGLGFYTGFWAFCGTLAVKNTWRLAYFRYLDHTMGKIYVIVAVNFGRFRRN